MEPWESGLIYIFAKDAGVKPPREFESRRLRQNWESAFLAGMLHPNFCGIYWTKFECFLLIILTTNDARLVRSLWSREQKPKIFLTFLIFLGGGWGGVDKKWKGNFWFCFAATDYEINIFIISFVVLWRCSFLRPCGETRRFLSMFCGSLILCGFDREQW